MKTFDVLVSASFNIQVEADDHTEAERKAREMAHADWRSLPFLGPPSWHFQAVAQDDWGV